MSTSTYLADSYASQEDGYNRIDRYSWAGLSLQRGIRIKHFGCLLASDNVYEIVENVRLSPMPGASSIFKGLSNHRGNVVPVYDMHALAGVQPPVWERKRLLILNPGRDAVAIRLYELPLQVRLGQAMVSDRNDTVPQIFAHHCSEAYASGDMLWLKLKLEDFFTELSNLHAQFKESVINE